jgi:hypothetical protein
MADLTRRATRFAASLGLTWDGEAVRSASGDVVVWTQGGWWRTADAGGNHHNPSTALMAYGRYLGAEPEPDETMAGLRAEVDRLRARVTELEAPGECQSLHKLRAEVERMRVERDAARALLVRCHAHIADGIGDWRPLADDLRAALPAEPPTPPADRTEAPTLADRAAAHGLVRDADVGGWWHRPAGRRPSGYNALVWSVDEDQWTWIPESTPERERLDGPRFATEDEALGAALSWLDAGCPEVPR